jgi:hypothetical protein
MMNMVRSRTDTFLIGIIEKKSTQNIRVVFEIAKVYQQQ